MATGDQRRGCGCMVLLAVVGAFCIGLLAGAAALLVAFFGGMDFESGPGVAVLDVQGELVDGYCILADLERLLADPDTRALVVRVDSAGGAVTVAEEVYNALKRARDDGMPVVVSMGTTAASGGYYLSLAAERIFANNGTLTGSIGIVLEYPSAEELFDKIGIRFDAITSGEFKSAGGLGQPITDRQRQHFKLVVEDFHEQFVALICADRGLTDAEARAVADGRVFTGRQAVELGLVDEVGDLYDAVAYAAKQGGIEGEPRVIRRMEAPLSFWGLVDEFSHAFWSRLVRSGPVAKLELR